MIENCYKCETILLEGELFLCDSCHMSAVVDKLFYKVIEEGI